MAGSGVRSREEVARSIIALLVTEKPSYNIPISKLEHCYRQEEGERVPYKDLGYPSITEFLRTIPEIQLIQREGYHFINFLGSEKTRHVSELVAKQKVTPKAPRGRSTCRRRIPPGYVQRSQSLYPPRAPDNSRLVSEVANIINKSNGISKIALVHKVREKKAGFFDIHGLQYLLNHLGNEIIVKDTMIYPANGVKSPQNEDHWNPDGERALRKPVSVQNLDIEMESRNGVVDDDDEDFNDFEYVSGASTSQQPDEMNNQQSLVVAEAQVDVNNKRRKPDVNDPRTKAEVELIVNDRMRFRLEKLIQNRPNGIWCAELAKHYFAEYKIQLEWDELGFTSLSDLVLHLPEIFRCIQKSPSGDFWVYYAKNKEDAPAPMRPTLSSVYQVYEHPDDDVPAVPWGPLSSATIKHLIPDDAVPIGESIGQVLAVEFNQEDKGYEEVVICDAFTPSFFWIHLRRKILRLNAMMERLQEFYDEKAPHYCVPLVVLERGMNVVCQFYGKWHRGIVKAVDPDTESMTTVLFYDYGTLHKYPASTMHFLQRSFATLPAQAIPCGLYNVKPYDDGSGNSTDAKGRWSIETSRLFVQRVHDKPLVAMCGKMDSDNNSLLLSLTDTSSDEDVNIGDWLVDKGLAMHGSMVRIRPKNFPFKYYLTCGEKSPQTCDKSIKKLSQNVTKPVAPSDVSKLSNDKKRVSRIDSLKAKVFAKESPMPKEPPKCLKCPTCGQQITQTNPQLTDDLPQPMEILTDNLPQVNALLNQKIEHWVETGYITSPPRRLRRSRPSAAWDQQVVTPSEVIAPPNDSIPTKTSNKIKDYKISLPSPASPIPFNVNNADLDAMSEFDTAEKPKRMKLNAGYIDWESALYVDDNPPPKEVQQLEILKSIPKPKRKIIETQERLVDAGLSSREGRTVDESYEMIIPTVKQALKNNKRSAKYLRIVKPKDYLMATEGNTTNVSGPIEVSKLKVDDDLISKGMGAEIPEKEENEGEEKEEIEVKGEKEEVEANEMKSTELTETIPQINSSIQENKNTPNIKVLIEEIIPEDNETPKKPKVLIEELTSSSDSEEIEMVSVYAEFLRNSPRFLRQVFDENQGDESTELDSDDELDEDESEVHQLNTPTEDIEIMETKQVDNNEDYDEFSELVDIIRTAEPQLKEKSLGSFTPAGYRLPVSRKLKKDESSIKVEKLPDFREIEVDIEEDNNHEIKTTDERSDHDDDDEKKLKEDNLKLEVVNNSNCSEQIPVFDNVDLSSDDEEFECYVAPMSWQDYLRPSIVAKVNELMMNRNHDNHDDDNWESIHLNKLILESLKEAEHTDDDLDDNDDDDDNLKSIHPNEMILESSKETEHPDDDHDDIVEEISRSPEGSIAVIIDPNDLDNYTEDYDWEAAEKIDQNPVKFQENLHNECYVKIVETQLDMIGRLNTEISTLKTLLVDRESELMTTFKTLLLDRGSELMAAIKALYKLGENSSIGSMMDQQLLHSMEEHILDDRQKFNLTPTILYHVLLPSDNLNHHNQSACNGNYNDDDHNSMINQNLVNGEESGIFNYNAESQLILTSVNADDNQDIDNQESEFSNSETYCNATDSQENGTLEPSTENDFDTSGSFHSDSPVDRMLEECDESMYSGYELLDSNPFKEDLLSAATSPFPEILHNVPPPIPPRTKRYPSISNLLKMGGESPVINAPSPQPRKHIEVNNNHTTEYMNTAEIETWRNANYLYERDSKIWNSPVVYAPKELGKAPLYTPPLPPRNLRKEVVNNNGFKTDQSKSVETISSSISPIRKIKSLKAADKMPDWLKVDLSRCSVFIFFINGSAWITIDQFRLAFTNFSDTLPIRKLLVERKGETCFRIIRREDDERLFNLIDSKVTQDGDEFQSETISFYLIPVNAVLVDMLRAFQLVSQEDITRCNENKGITGHPVLMECSQLIMGCVRLMNN